SKITRARIGGSPGDGDLGVGAEDALRGAGGGAPDSTLRGDAELRRERDGGRDPATRTLRAVLPVHEAEVELLDRGELRERGEVGLVIVGDRHGKVQPGERTVGRGDDGVGVADEGAGVGRLEEVLLPRVAVAEVHAHLDVVRDGVNEGGETRDEAVERVTGPPRLHDGAVTGGALDDPHLARDVPLHGEVVVRDRGEDLVELAEHRGGVHGLDRGPVVAVEERGDDGERGGQRHLEPGARRDGPLLTQPGEEPVRLDRRGGVPQRRQRDRRGIHALGDPEAPGVDAGGERAGLVADPLDADIPRRPTPFRPSHPSACGRKGVGHTQGGGSARGGRD
ncbi:unnamed protein product, partial [Penicillium discolor]